MERSRKEPKIRDIPKKPTNLSPKIFEEKMLISLEESLQNFFKEKKLCAENIVSVSYNSQPEKIGENESIGYYSCLLIYRDCS